ncbi:uncharacterized protein ACLA_086810 [Aspergillus clavatus NRRL 1]|uniref:Uncharacterized protein n=1 Tax=Aspergillus clavatus (strain ATCC 1007 / CBS 513.65 / DSM 816 / NCTC 3887 / NRRL 1 / QM 1276 / 107) TaxID=344612 RepID=A1CUJ2_ASPCL|nr:uncharacterized protein ACLA_086810 [Aspergillus clavatus NRRL 1]EAW06979.1 conserved hypothetical protein [Aspergillus clavatus NRRL 1]
MAFKERFRKVFHRNSNGHSKSKSNSNGNGIKIEYYKRHEIPRSKFRGPFDPEHQKRLAAWSFDAAQADRPRSFDYSLSPCTTLPDHLKPRHEESATEDEELAPNQGRDIAPPEVGLIDSPVSIFHHEYAPGRQEESSASSSSTAVEFSSYSSNSTMTLYSEPPRLDSITQIKETIRYTSPMLRAVSPPPLSPKGAFMPFSPDDLTRALNAVQICS